MAGKTKIKLCGLSRPCDIEVCNEWKPDYIGFVFVPNSRRYLPMEQATILKRQLHSDIKAVGVFTDEDPKIIAKLSDADIIDIIQLHGRESLEYIEELRILTNKPIIKAFSINKEKDIQTANASTADYVLLDSGNGGTGTTFNWDLLQKMERPYFLAGGLTGHNVENAVKTLKPYAVDVSSGIETNGYKDKHKMETFIHAVRNANS